MGYTQVQVHKTMVREEVQQLKAAKVPKLEAYKRLTQEGKKLSWPTFLKYYNAQGVPSARSVDEKYEKQKAFDVEPFKQEIIRCLKANSDNKSLKVSSIYDLLVELFVDSGAVTALPGNEQTLRNYIHGLKAKGLSAVPEPSFREMDYVDEQTIPYGEQAQLDYGQQRLLDGSVVHFIAMELRRSRFLSIQPQDHPFTAEESAAALYSFMVRIGGRFKTLVIDQDRCLVHGVRYGEITLTRVFQDFLQEQELTLYVCHAQDPQTKGQIEDLVKYVKTNYFSARLKTGLSVDGALIGIPKWCDRKNAAIRLPFRKVPSICLKEEAPYLRPLVASQYSEHSGTYTLSSVDKLGYITYLSNKYSVPKILRNTKVRTKVYGERLCVYELDTDRLITDHVISDQQNRIITKEEHKRKESVSWTEYRDKLCAEFTSPSLSVFVEGIIRENPRYKKEQLKELYEFLIKEQATGKLLDAVLALLTASQGGHYRVTEFEEVFTRMLQQRAAVNATESLQQTLKARRSVEVETRDPTSYAARVRQLTVEA